MTKFNIVRHECLRSNDLSAPRRPQKASGKSYSLRPLQGLIILTSALIAGISSGGSAYAQPQSGVSVGALSCDVSSGWGVIFGSTRNLKCTFQPVKGSIERYTGHISKYGVDLGYTNGGIIVWAVLSPTSDLSPGSLSGRYTGATAGATAGLGVGVHALIGGSNKSIALQPASIEGNTGLNVAAGIADVNLKHVSQ